MLNGSTIVYSPLQNCNNPYEKENLPLRPLLQKYLNVEDNVHTLTEQDESYLRVDEIIDLDKKNPNVMH
jgi:hypothetical protein